MATKAQESILATTLQLVWDILYITYSLIKSALFFATLPVTQRLCARKPNPPTLLARNIRYNQADIQVFPKLSSVFNVETYEIKKRTLAPDNSLWQPAGHSKDTGADIHVGSLQEYTEYEVRGRAHNIRGTSDWSKPIRVLTRRKAIDGGCDNGLYKWTQTHGEVVIQLAVPISVKGMDVMVALKDRNSLEIQVSLGARDSRRVEGLLRKPVKSFGNGSTWELITEGSCKLVVVTLEKELFGQWWTSALKGHAEIDLQTVPGYDPPPFDPSTYRM
ncbi:g3663 [Coccomyxa elongata]